MLKKLLVLFALSSLLACQGEGTNGVDSEYQNPSLTTEQRVESLISQMSLEEKAAQMIQGEKGSVQSNFDKLAGIGSVLSGGGSTPTLNTPEGWTEWIKEVQENTMTGPLKIPSIYGIDAVHGHSNVKNSTIFPHNIGLGAANDAQLMTEMGKVVAYEMFQTRILWNFGPCVAIAEDPRWGRTYESFSTDPEITADLSVAYLNGFMSVGGVGTAKHFIGDGNTIFGTGMNGGTDRGNAEMSMDEIRNSILIPYQRLVDSGVQVVMTSFSSLNGLKMHNNSDLINGVLKSELGFTGFVITDWEGIQEIPGMSYAEQVWASINAGNDMLMEPNRWAEAKRAIISGVEQNKIEMSRIDDAVRRILTVKFDSGLFEDPNLDELSAGARQLRDTTSLAVARELVEKSMVLLKNDNSVLPIQSGQKVLLLGPVKDDIGSQCGGWTISWQGRPDGANELTEGTTLLESLTALSEEVGFELVTDEGEGLDADLVIIAIGEKPYAEMQGDVTTPDLHSNNAHSYNERSIRLAKQLELPTVALIIAGRHISIEEYIDDWDAVVMAYLPGTEGDGMGRVLTNQAPFSGKLPMNWYKEIDGETVEEFEILFERGYGLTY